MKYLKEWRAALPTFDIEWCDAHQTCYVVDKLGRQRLIWGDVTIEKYSWVCEVMK